MLQQPRNLPLQDQAPASRMKTPAIIFLNRFFYPDHAATSQFLSDLTFTLADRGRQVHVITSRQRYDRPGSALPYRDRISGVEIHRVWTSRFGRNWLPGRAMDYFTFYTSAAWTLFWLARDGDIIVAKTDPPLISAVAALVARLRGAWLVNWLQDLFPEVAITSGIRIFRYWPGQLLRGLRNASLRCAAVNVVLDTRMASYLQNQGISRKCVAVIHNWADSRSIKPVEARDNPLREFWGLHGRFVVGYSGNLGRVHEFHTMLGAMEQLRNQRDIVFLFIGSGHRHEELKNAVERRRLDNVRFQPYQPREKLSDSLSVPDVHLVSLPSCFEGFVVPSKFYGIAAAGRPVLFIGGKTNELAQIIVHEQCGVVISEGDTDALVKAILGLRNDPALREVQGQNARALLLRRFDRTLSIDAWQQLLDKLDAEPVSQENEL